MASALLYPPYSLTSKSVLVQEAEMTFGKGLLPQSVISGDRTRFGQMYGIVVLFSHT